MWFVHGRWFGSVGRQRTAELVGFGPQTERSWWSLGRCKLGSLGGCHDISVEDDRSKSWNAQRVMLCLTPLGSVEVTKPLHTPAAPH